VSPSAGGFCSDPKTSLTLSFATKREQETERWWAMSNKWKAWQYLVLNEGHNVRKTARLLDRSPKEVFARLTTWYEWYRRQRCAGSPKNPDKLLWLAGKICREDFPDLLAENGWEHYAFEVLDYSFKTFDPTRGDQAIPVQERFVRCFRCWLKQALKKEDTRRRRGPKTRSFDVLSRFPQPSRSHEDVAAAYAWWAYVLLQKALARLDGRTRKCLELRLQGKRNEEIAKRLGVATKTVSNHYSSRKLVELAQREVRSLVLGMPAADFRSLAVHLLTAAGLSFVQVARLWCISQVELRQRLTAGSAEWVVGLEPEEALGLLARAA
jgi:hypothetical protein